MFQHAAFWDWLYSLGERPLGDVLYAQLQQDSQHRVQTLALQLDDGTAVSHVHETALIDWPVSAHCRFRSLLCLGPERRIEEVLYLQRDGQDHVVAWIDAHAHERLFRLDEFKRLMAHIERDQGQAQADAAWLYFARYLALLSELDAAWLTAQLGPRYQRLCQVAQPLRFVTRKLSPYGTNVGMGLDMRLKAVRSRHTALGFVINAGARWVQDAHGHWALVGFAANSLRMPEADAAAAFPGAVADQPVAIDADTRNPFPNQTWDALMAELDAATRQAHGETAEPAQTPFASSGKNQPTRFHRIHSVGYQASPP